MLATLLSPIKHLYTLSPGIIFSAPLKAFTYNPPAEAFTYNPPDEASTVSPQDNATHSSTNRRRRTSRLLRKESSLTLHTKRADARRAYVKHQHQQRKRISKKESSTLPLPGAWPGTFYQPVPLSSDPAPAPVDSAAGSATHPPSTSSNSNHTKSIPTNIPSLVDDAQTAFSSEPGLSTSDEILLDQLKILGRKTDWKKELENARELADRGVESARAEKKMWEDAERSGKAKKWDGRLMGWEERKRRCEAKKALAKEKERLQDGYAFWRVRYGGSGADQLKVDPDGEGRKGTGVNWNAGAKTGKTTYRGRHEPYVPPRPIHPRPQFRPQRPPPESQPSPPQPPQVHHGQTPAQTSAQFTEALKKMVEEATRARERQAVEELARRKEQEDIEATRLYKEWREAKDRLAREAQEKAESEARWKEKVQRIEAEERKRQRKEAREKRQRDEQGQQEGRQQQRPQPTYSTATSTTSSELLKLFEAYEAKWTVLKSTPPPPLNVACPLDQQVAFQDLPWPLLFSPSSLLDFNTSNIGAFIFHPQRPGIIGKHKKDIVRAEMKRWHPDKFEASVGRRIVVPVNTEGGQEVVKEVSKAITGALNDLFCTVG